MDSIAFLCMGFQVIFGFAGGMRLLALARRMRRLPELALSLQTLLLPARGYPSSLVAIGLDPAAMTLLETSAVVAKILPAELAARGVAAGESLCRERGPPSRRCRGTRPGRH
jgi:hypothetical protein